MTEYKLFGFCRWGWSTLKRTNELRSIRSEVLINYEVTVFRVVSKCILLLIYRHSKRHMQQELLIPSTICQTTQCHIPQHRHFTVTAMRISDLTQNKLWCKPS